MQIEAVTTEDAEELLEIYAPYVEDTAITFEYLVPSREEFEQRIRTISAKYPYLKAVEDGKILGYAYAGTFKGRAAYDWSVETTVYVRQQDRQKGVGKRLYEALEGALKDMGILNMNACIAIPKNTLPDASCVEENAQDSHLTADSFLFHRKMGFELVGCFHDSGYKFNTWYDMIWMEKMLGEHKSVQKPVRFGDWRIG